MQLFAHLIEQLDQSGSAARKIVHFKEYLNCSSDENIIWAISLVTGRRPKRLATAQQLKDWAIGEAEVPLWLFEQSLTMSGDLAETAALLTPSSATGIGEGLHYLMIAYSEVVQATPAMKKQFVLSSWRKMRITEKYVFNKLITGSFRVSLPVSLIARAIAEFTDQSAQVVQYKLSRVRHPSEISFRELMDVEDPIEESALPFPFQQTAPTGCRLESLGDPGQWQAEFDRPGINVQIIKRNGLIHVWSEKGDLITSRFPEFCELIDVIPNGTVIAGQIVAFQDGSNLKADLYQKRMKPIKISNKIIRETPVLFFAFDLLEFEAVDVRKNDLKVRRAILDELLKEHPHSLIALSETIDFDQWTELRDVCDRARAFGASGLIIKRLCSSYSSNDKHDQWLCLKPVPLSVRTVLLYAEGGGKSVEHTQFTLAVWNGSELVPVTKVENNLDEDESRAVNAFINGHVLEKFGPVRSVVPELVFEIEFDSIEGSSRRKSGLVLKGSRIKNWAKALSADKASTLNELKAKLEHPH